jgi:hypothetical protein
MLVNILINGWDGWVQEIEVVADRRVHSPSSGTSIIIRVLLDVIDLADLGMQCIALRRARDVLMMMYRCERRIILM